MTTTTTSRATTSTATSRSRPRTRLRAERLTPAIGSVVEGVDLGLALDTRTIGCLADLLIERQVLFFRDQLLDSVGQCNFAEQFGTLAISPLQRLTGSTRPYSIIDDTELRPPADFDWHTDVSWSRCPPHIGILNALVIPECGGDTLWASGAAAYESLPRSLQGLASTLRVRHRMDDSYLATVAEHHGENIAGRLASENPAVEHPLVRAHPVTGRPALWLSPLYQREIVGVTSAESRSLLAVFNDAIEDPSVQVRWRWRVGDVAMWDETSTCHRALADHFPAHRRMRRCTTEGTRPLGSPPVHAQPAK